MLAVLPELARHDEARLVRQNRVTGQRMHDHQWLRYYLDFRGKYSFDGSPEFTRFSGPWLFTRHGWSPSGIASSTRSMFFVFAWSKPRTSCRTEVSRSGGTGGSDRRSDGRSSGTADRFRSAIPPRHPPPGFLTLPAAPFARPLLKPCLLLPVGLSLLTNKNNYMNLTKWNF